MKKIDNLFKTARLGDVYGGPFAQVEQFLFPGDCTINLKAESPNEKSTFYLPIPDFNVPDPQRLKYSILVACQALADGYDVYAGCMGGRGRTGTFMACLVGIIRPDVKDPVLFVRANYNEHAVETPEQRRYVYQFVKRNRQLSNTCRAILRLAVRRGYSRAGERARSRKSARKNRSHPLTKVA